MREKFKALLDEEYDWPADFHFKFIVPTEQVAALTELLKTDRIKLKASRNNRYTSINAWMKLSSSDEVIYVYDRVEQIPGIIAL
jgi:uncharacterized protein